MDNKLLKFGLAGGFVTALCCFTPLLVWGLTTIGLAAVIGYLDIVLLPTLIVFILITGYALWRRKQKT